jgi:hypothetical protein
MMQEEIGDNRHEALRRSSVQPSEHVSGLLRDQPAETVELLLRRGFHEIMPVDDGHPGSLPTAPEPARDLQHELAIARANICDLGCSVRNRLSKLRSDDAIMQHDSIEDTKITPRAETGFIVWGQIIQPFGLDHT